MSPIPTRWIAQLDGQLADAERRLAAADRHLAAGLGGRAVEEVYPGVMGAAMVKVWLTDEPWHRQRTAEDLQRMVRAELPGGFQALFEMRLDQRSFAGWRPEDAMPLIEEARGFVTAVRAALTKCTPRPPT